MKQSIRRALLVAVAAAPFASPWEARAAVLDDAAIATGPPEAAGAIVGAPRLFGEDDLLLFEVHSGDLTLSDGLGAYSSRAGVFIPIGELSRLLDLDIAVDPQRQRAEGWAIADKTRLSVDLATRTARVGDRVLTLSSTEVALKDGEIYVRADTLQQLLPLKLSVDKAALVLQVTPTERMPFQERLEREARREMLGASRSQAQPVLRVQTPYRVFTPPALEVSLQADAGNDAPKHNQRYEVRAAGDLAFMGAQAYLSSDERGRPDTARILFERKDPGGHLLGPLRLTRIDLGDVFTPSLVVGPRSTGGRGVSFTSAPLEQASIFDKTDIRGELPVGYEAELYVNEVLRASQSQAVDGRYEFKSVDLAYGLNIVRIVLYGPHGERREEVRRINVGGGQLSKGQVAMTFGAVQENAPLIVLHGLSSTNTTPGQNDLRIAGQIAYGLTNTTTLSLAAARYTPRLNDPRSLLTLGVATSLAGFATQVDIATDSDGAQAFSLGVAGRWRGISLIGQHKEYRGDFADEVDSSSSSGPRLLRTTDLRADTNLRIADGMVPAAVHFSLRDFAGGEAQATADMRLSRAFGRYLVSSSLTYLGTSGGGFASGNTLTGGFDATGLVGGHWQLRGNLSYRLAPTVLVDAMSITADRQLNDRIALHLGVTHSFASDRSTQFQAGGTFRLDAFDASVTGGYDTARRDFRIGLQLTMGFAFDPLRGRYRVVGPGAATGGSAVVRAFRDVNGDGAWERGEPGVPGLVFEGGRRAAKTDDQGRAFVTNLGDAASARVHADTESIDDPYLAAPPADIEMTPRAGRTAVISYPMGSRGEVEVRALFRVAGGTVRGLSALNLELVDDAGRVVAHGRTEFDGTASMQSLRPGRYAVRIEPDQARRLHMQLAKAVTIEVPRSGGFIGQVAVEIVLVQAVAP